MKLVPPPLAIGPDDGFDNTDLFGYKGFGERLANRVETFDSATVIVLDGPWGSGKTTFTQQWAGLLRQRGHAVVQFDAFAHDYQDDAFVALAGEVLAQSQHEDTKGFEKYKASLRKAAGAVRKKLPSIATHTVVNLVPGVLFLPFFSKLLSAGFLKLFEAIESAQTSQLEKRIEKSHESAKAVSEFRKCLSELAGKLATASPTAETQPPEEAPRKFVFIIDELDRCRPTFALSLLEHVKHLFSVDEICFVLVAHLPQLAKMVEKEYGVTSGQRYLEKFYSLPLTFSVARKRPHKQYLKYLIENMMVQEEDYQVFSEVFEGLSALAGTYGLPLRTFEHVVRNVALICLETNPNSFRCPPLIAGLCVMRVVDPKLYEKARTERLGMDEAIQFLRLEEWHAESVELITWIKNAWIYATATEKELNTATHKNIEQGWGNADFDISRLDMITATCEYIDLW